MDKFCEECNEKFIGRSDARFCSDQCRSSFNNKQNASSGNYVRKINRILSKNRRILESLNPKGKSKTTKKKLLAEGFNFDYFTNVYNTKNGNKYFFCYDQGYLELENEYYALVIKKEYI